MALVAGLAAATPALAVQDVGQDASDEPSVAASLEGNYLAAVVAGASRDASAAARFFGEALRADPRNRDLQERAFIAFLASGEMTDAFATAQKILARDQRNSLARLAIGVRDFREGRHAQARTQFQRSGGAATDVTATLLSAWAWAGSGDVKKALATVDRLKGVNAFNLFREYHGGLIAASGGPRFRKEADQRLSATYAMERTTLRVVDAYGRYLSQAGDRDAATAAYEAFLKAAPRQPIAMAALEQLKQGKTLPPFAADARQGAAEVLYGLGAAGNQQGDELAAMIYLQLSLYLEPKNEMALVTLADIYDRLRKHEDALAVYRQIPADSPMRAMADIQIGMGLEALERKDEAEKQLQKLVETRPDDVDAAAALGALYRGRKEWLKAADAYTKAIKASGKPETRFWSLYYFRGMCWERAKQWPKAEADLKQALELAPEGDGRERAVVLNYLGYSWVDQHLNLKEAFDMLHKAVALRPRDGYIVDSLGWAYYRLGRYDDAVRELERAIALKPSDPTINDHLGDAYWKTGRKLEAKFQWNHARDLDPEPDDLPKILAKIANGMPQDDKSGPAKSDGGKSDGGKSDGGKADEGKPVPGKGEPKKSEPGKSEPGKSEPGKSAPGDTTPAKPDAPPAPSPAPTPQPDKDDAPAQPRLKPDGRGAAPDDKPGQTTGGATPATSVTPGDAAASESESGASDAANPAKDASDAAASGAGNADGDATGSEKPGAATPGSGATSD